MPEAPRDVAEVVPRGTRVALPLIGFAALIGLLGLPIVRGAGGRRLRGISLARRGPLAWWLRTHLGATGHGGPVLQEELAAVWAAARDRAKEGDVEAAAVVIEVARQQRSDT